MTGRSLAGRLRQGGIVKDIIIVAVGLAVIWVGLQLVFGTPNPFYVVSSGSMIPELEVFDILVVNGNKPFEDIRIGDIIVFNRPAGEDRVIVHRVVSVIDQDPYTVRTKGDANPASIPGTDFPITDEEYIGQVAYVVPQVGYITRVLSPPTNYIIVAIIIGVMAARHIYKKKRESPDGLEPGADPDGSQDEDGMSGDAHGTDTPRTGGPDHTQDGTSKDASDRPGGTDGR